MEDELTCYLDEVFVGDVLLHGQVKIFSLDRMTAALFKATYLIIEASTGKESDMVRRIHLQQQI